MNADAPAPRSAPGEGAAGRAAGRVGAALPVFQAGMGGIAGPRLVAAVAEAGGAGIVGLYKHPPQEITALIAETAGLTGRAFGINLVPEVVSEAVLVDQVRAVLAAPAETPPFVSFYGLPPRAAITPARDVGREVIVQIGSVFDAVEAVNRGATQLIIQGHEAGGHHLSRRPMADLVAALVERLPAVPVIAAGGISSGEAAAAAAAAGADAVLAGTAFICAAESAAHDVYRAKVMAACAADTVVSDRFEIGWPGRPHRVLRNAVTEAAVPPEPAFIGRTVLFGRPYPVPRGSAAVPTIHSSGRIEEMALYCGTGCDAVTRIEPAAAIVARLATGFAAGRNVSATDPTVTAAPVTPVTARAG